MRHQTSKDGSLNIDCAETLTYLGDVYMRIAAISCGDQIMNEAKRAEFCFVQAVDIYRTYNDHTNEVNLMNRLNKSKRVQLRMRRKISFSDDPPKSVYLSSSSDSSFDSVVDYEPCKPVVSDITWMDSYSSEYYRQQHSRFLKESVLRPNRVCIFDFVQGNLCSCFSEPPPVSTIEFVEQRLDL